MSKPKLDIKDAHAGAMHNLISAMSALHMDCLEIENVDEDAFLDEKFYWVKHSREHLDAILPYLDKLFKLQEAIWILLLFSGYEEIDKCNTDSIINVLGNRIRTLRLKNKNEIPGS